jgi:hypothetical protein
MTLGTIRANGVRSLDVSCWICHDRAIMSADRWSDGECHVRLIQNTAGWLSPIDSAPLEKDVACD